MSIETCQHEEYVDYTGMRKLGYCHKCGRVMEYDPTGGGERPQDVTAEFEGRNPFTEQPAFEHHRIAINGQSQDTGPQRGRFALKTPQEEAVARERGTRASAEARKIGQGGGRNNHERQRYYLEHKDAIIADVYRLGVPATRRKWGIPSSTFSHHLRVWGVAVPPEKRKTDMKRHYYDEHREAIEADIKAMPRTEVVKKWGMSKATYWRLKKRWGVIYEGKFDPQPVKFEPSHVASEDQVDAIAQALTDAINARKQEALTKAQQRCGVMDASEVYAAEREATLPPWRDDWAPEVQVQWLRTYEALKVGSHD